MSHPGIDPMVARRIRLVGFDVDGVLTDGGVYLGATTGTNPEPFELKRFDIQDGLGMQLLRQAGLRLAIITGRVSHSVAQRARELGIEECVQDPQARKLPAMKALCTRLGISLDNVAFVGDDLPDLPVLRAVGLPIAVGNAVPEVAAAAHLRLAATGGHGAVRELTQLLLEARGEWTTQVERYVASRMIEEPEPA